MFYFCVWYNLIFITAAEHNQQKTLKQKAINHFKSFETIFLKPP